jgi:chitodextrinase
VVGAADAAAPSAPSGLTAQQLAAPARVQLAWTASTDDVGVTGYEVSRDGAVLGTTAGLSFTDAAIAPNRTFSYAVVALDAAGNRSGAATASVTTTDDTPPPATTSRSAVLSSTLSAPRPAPPSAAGVVSSSRPPVPR